MFHSVTESPLEMSAPIQKEKQRGGASRLVSASATPTRLEVLAEHSSAHNLGHVYLSWCFCLLTKHGPKTVLSTALK